MEIRKHLIIKGRVQGVYFRDFTRGKAMELGVRGWVRNLSNGDVESLIIGERNTLEKMMEWVWEGPPMAMVRQVIENSIKEAEDIDGFEIRK